MFQTSSPRTGPPRGARTPLGGAFWPFQSPGSGPTADGAAAIKVLVLLHNLPEEIRPANSVPSCKSPPKHFLIQ